MTGIIKPVASLFKRYSNINSESSVIADCVVEMLDVMLFEENELLFGNSSPNYNLSRNWFGIPMQQLKHVA